MALVNALTTLANAKLIAGITGNTADPTLELLINRASAKVTQYLGRNLARNTYTEKLPATSRQLLIVNEYPIISITSIKSLDKTLTLNSDYRLDAQDANAGMIYKENGWEPYALVSGLTLDIMAAARTIDVVYVAGYYLPNDTTTAPADPHYVAGDAGSLPMDIQGVVDELVTEAYFKILRKSQGLKSYSEGGISFSFAEIAGSTALGFTDEHAEILNKYKRYVVA